MDLKARLSRIKETLEEGRGNNRLLIIYPGDDVEQKKSDFEKVYGKDHDTIIISHKVRDRITR